LKSESGAELEFCLNDLVTWSIVTNASYIVPTVICWHVYEFEKCKRTYSLYAEIN